jgi:GNAT superfamily N-acetyltransferase
MAHTDDEVREWLSEVLLPDGGVYVAESGHQAVAMLAISTKEEVGWIDHLYVRPDWTGQGIGVMLLNVAHARLKPPFRPYTFQANSGARRFYERHGYQAVSFTDGHDSEVSRRAVRVAWRRVDHDRAS